MYLILSNDSVETYTLVAECESLQDLQDTLVKKLAEKPEIESTLVIAKKVELTKNISYSFVDDGHIVNMKLKDHEE